MRYLTYDKDGQITGAYLQDLLPEHRDAYFECDEAQYAARFNYVVKGGKLVAAPPKAQAPQDIEQVVLQKLEESKRSKIKQLLAEGKSVDEVAEHFGKQ